MLTYILDKFLGNKGDEGGESHATEKKYGQYHGNLYSLSIFPRQINEHGQPKVKDIFLFLLLSTFCLSDFQTTNTYMNAEGSKREVKEEQTTNTCMKDEGSQQGVEELEEPFELLSELDLLYSHYLEEQLSMILELLLTSPKMQPELWRR